MTMKENELFMIYLNIQDWNFEFKIYYIVTVFLSFLYLIKYGYIHQGPIDF